MDNKYNNVTSKLLELLNPEEVYSIGSHISGMHTPIINPDSVADSIAENGLILDSAEDVGLTGTVFMRGSTNYEEKIDNLVEGVYTNTAGEYPINVIVAVPGSIKGKDGKDYYLGTYPDDLGFISKEELRLKELPIEQFTKKIHKVPTEFILGMYVNINGEKYWSRNYRYISNLPEKEQAEILENFIQQGLEPITMDKQSIDDCHDDVLFTEMMTRNMSGLEKVYIGKKYVYDSLEKYITDKKNRGKTKELEEMFEQEENLAADEINRTSIK